MLYQLEKNQDAEKKTVVITGALGAIGRETARRFAKKGEKIILLDEKKEVETMAASLSKEFCTPVYGIVFKSDMMGRTEEVIQMVRKKVGNIDIFVHILGRLPGIGVYRGAADLDEIMVAEQMKKNVIGTYRFVEKMGETMMEQGNGGKIICVTSQDEYSAMKKHIGYRMSTAAIVSMMKQFAAEWEKDHINVNVIVPVVYHSDIDTEEWKTGLSIQLQKEMEANVIAEANMIANSIHFLTSVEANMMSGEEFVIDMKSSYLQEQKSA